MRQLVRSTNWTSTQLFRALLSCTTLSSKTRVWKAYSHQTKLTGSLNSPAILRSTSSLNLAQTLIKKTRAPHPRKGKSKRKRRNLSSKWRLWRIWTAKLAKRSPKQQLLGLTLLKFLKNIKVSKKTTTAVRKIKKLLSGKFPSLILSLSQKWTGIRFSKITSSKTLWKNPRSLPLSQNPKKSQSCLLLSMSLTVSRAATTLMNRSWLQGLKLQFRRMKKKNSFAKLRSKIKSEWLRLTLPFPNPNLSHLKIKFRLKGSLSQSPYLLPP